MTLYPWQDTLYAKWEAAGWRGVVEAVPGAGKTVAAITAIKRLGMAVTTVIVVDSRPLKAQWETELAAHGVTAEVVTIQTACKTPREVDLLIVDECHRTVSPVFNRLYAWRWAFILGLSATPDPQNLHDIGPILVKVPFEEAVISPFTVVFHTVPMSPAEMMGYNKITTQMRECAKARDEGQPVNPEWYDRLVIKRRDLVYKAKSRLPKAVEIVRARPEAKTLIICERIAQADEMADTLRSSGIEAGTYHSQNKDETALARFRSGDLRILASVKSLKQGFNVPDISLLVMVSTALSKVHHIQALGRAIRWVQGKEAEVHVILADGTTDIKVLGFRHLYRWRMAGGLDNF